MIPFTLSWPLALSVLPQIDEPFVRTQLLLAVRRCIAESECLISTFLLPIVFSWLIKRWWFTQDTVRRKRKRSDMIFVSVPMFSLRAVCAR